MANSILSNEGKIIYSICSIDRNLYLYTIQLKQILHCASTMIKYYVPYKKRTFPFVVMATLYIIEGETRNMIPQH